MKKALAVLIAVVLLLTPGCTGRVISTKPHITLITKSSQSNFWKMCFAGAKAAASEYNADLTITSPDSEEDYATQNKMIAGAVSSGTSAIVFSACDFNGSVKSVEKAIASGVPVISIDSEVNTDKVLIKISTDNIQAGSMAADAMIASTGGHARIGIVNFAEGTANGQQRQQGFIDRIKSQPGMQVLEVRNALSTIDSSEQATKELIKKYPEMDAIVTFNEWTTLGVGQAITDMGLGGKIKVVGFDNNIASIKEMEDGVVTALIVQNPYSMGYLGVEYALQSIKGNVTPQTIDTGTVIITKDNMFDPQNQKLLFPFS
jgi:ribose transport system substrate-binding protein